MSPRNFRDLRGVTSWVQYMLAAESLVKFLDMDDPEDTLMAQFTVSEVSFIAFSALVMGRIFPELLPIASDLCTKLTEISDAQEFLRRDESE